MTPTWTPTKKVNLAGGLLRTYRRAHSENATQVIRGAGGKGSSASRIIYKQLDRAPLRYRSAEHGPACLARSARSQTIGRFAPS